MHAEPKPSYVTKKQPLTMTQQRAIVAACRDPVDRQLVLPILDGGLRLKEWASILPGDLEDAILRVGDRMVELTSRAASALQKRFKRHQSMPLKERAAEYRLQEVATRAGLSRVTPDVLRRTYAANLQRGGATPADLQSKLGMTLASAIRLFLALSKSEAA